MLNSDVALEIMIEGLMSLVEFSMYVLLRLLESYRQNSTNYALNQKRFDNTVEYWSVGVDDQLTLTLTIGVEKNHD